MVSEGTWSLILASLQQDLVHGISTVRGCTAPTAPRSSSKRGRAGFGEDVLTEVSVPTAAAGAGWRTRI